MNPSKKSKIFDRKVRLKRVKKIKNKLKTAIESTMDKSTTHTEKTKIVKYTIGGSEGSENDKYKIRNFKKRKNITERNQIMKEMSKSLRNIEEK